MKVKQTLEEVKKIAGAGNFKVVPLSCEILADVKTPIEVLRVLKNVSAHTYLLESVTEKESWGRYTFLGYNPKLCITCTNGKMKIGDTEILQKIPPPKYEKFWQIIKARVLKICRLLRAGL